MRATLIALALAASLAATRAQAQDELETGKGWRPELRPFIGLSIPTGAQRHEVMGDALIGLQAGAELRPTFHVVGTLSWTMTETKRPVREGADVLQYDAGVELGHVNPLNAGFELRQFAGVGAGARTYLYRGGTLRDYTCAAGYGALGAELQLAESSVRLETRGNAFCYRAADGTGSSHTRVDLGFVVGYAYHFR